MADKIERTPEMDSIVADTVWSSGIIDVNEALGRVLGHKAMYKRWLDNFFVPATMSVVNDAFGEQDYEKMHTAVHKLKGTAANLSINVLAEQARVLDDLIKNATPFAELREVFDGLAECYEKAERLYRSNPNYIDEFPYNPE